MRKRQRKTFDGDRFTLICPYPKTTAGKLDVKKRKRGSCRVLANSPEMQELKGEEISKSCEKLERREKKDWLFKRRNFLMVIWLAATNKKIYHIMKKVM